jgi:hypothetical protein
VLPFVQLQATSAEDAQRKAHHTTGCAIAEVQRIEPVDDGTRNLLTRAHFAAQAARFAA